jgi:hypothetical protein
MSRLLSAFLVPLVLAGAAIAEAGNTKPTAVVTIEPYGGGGGIHCVRAVVGGREGRFLFDTGGGISAVTPAFAAAIGCEPWGRITGFRMGGDRLDLTRCDSVTVEIGGGKQKMPTIGVFDIMRFFPPNSDPIDGAIGLDVFANRAVTIDPARGELIVESQGSLAARMKAGREIAVRPVRDAQGLALTFDAGVKTPKGVAWMELDTGNVGTFVVATHIAPLLSLDPKVPEGQQVAMTLTGGIEAKGTARVIDCIMDGNIGQGFLNRWLLTIDCAHGRAWLAPASRSDGVAGAN